MKHRSSIWDSICDSPSVGIVLCTLVTGIILFGCANTPTGRQLFVPVVTTNVETDGWKSDGRLLTTTNYVTNYIVNPGVTNALGLAADISKKIPLPWSEIATTVLGLATGILAWIAKVKSDRAALGDVVIAGIEAAPNNGDVKTTIQRIAQQTGVEHRLNKAVRRVRSAKVKMEFGQKP